MKKIDIHLHLGTETVEHILQQPAGKQTYSSGNTPQSAVMKIIGVRDMLPHLEELGISGGILMSGGESGGLGNNDVVRQAASMVPGVYKWMCNVDPVDPETLGGRLDEKLAEGKLSQEVYEKICRKNAERLFGAW